MYNRYFRCPGSPRAVLTNWPWKDRAKRLFYTSLVSFWYRPLPHQKRGQYIQSCWYFRPSFVNYCPSNMLPSSPSRYSPSLCQKSGQSTVYADIVWLGSGGVLPLSPVGNHILQKFKTLYLTRFWTYKIARPTKQKPLFCTDSANIFYQPPPRLPRNGEKWRRRKRHWHNKWKGCHQACSPRLPAHLHPRGAGESFPPPPIYPYPFWTVWGCSGRSWG